MHGRHLLLSLLVYTLLEISVLHVDFVLTEETNDAQETEKLDETGESDKPVRGTVSGTVTSLEAYIRLFKQHRATQLDAVKSIQQFSSSYEKKYKLVDTIVKQLFKVIADAKTNLTDWGYIPGDSFPENNTIREALSHVLENTAMFGDLILRQPDITHVVYKKNKEWEFLIGWAVWTAMESSVFQGTDEKMLNLMSQELGLIPKEDDYVNPYKEEEILKQMDSQAQSQKDKKKKNKDKKKSKEKKKGPRLSGSAHTEL